jgi:hypothetical protein
MLPEFPERFRLFLSNDPDETLWTVAGMRILSHPRWHLMKYQELHSNFLP